MNKSVNNIIIVGGGTSGWISAAILAKKFASIQGAPKVTLIESKNVPTIGVGEGTWPTMRNTLKRIGITETDLITQCDATFKQASKFEGWVTGNKSDVYFHPFNSTKGYPRINLANFWGQDSEIDASFSRAVSCQESLCEQGLAPKLISTAEYKDLANYGYHLDAAKFASLLKKHCLTKLNVKHIEDQVVDVKTCIAGNISAVVTQHHQTVHGDLFIDCSGFSSILLGKALDVPFISKQHILFNDSAITAHVPYASEDQSIPCFTRSSAQPAGWIWDIGLPHRRGVGYVYSSQHCSDTQAKKQLQMYIGTQSVPTEFRKISFKAGHREVSWKNNCVAIGLSAGFLEPLEASALMFVETAATMLADQFPATYESMPSCAKRFNHAFIYRWHRVIDFLKLHYVLSQRSEQYWRDNREASSIPSSLQALLEDWKHMPPSDIDFASQLDIFRAPSYQYVLYGMGFKTNFAAAKHTLDNSELANKFFDLRQQEQQKLSIRLPKHRELIDKIHQYGFMEI
ncbi:MAG: tryptophan halogenase family protein [Paraglaciecola sp.]|uniref:tryptophan halogenase family protein n=2 Tax=Paraglaciecola sp. TaxID=1920173 RepID=UPI003267327A